MKAPTLAILGIIALAGYFWFAQLLISYAPLEEVKITIQHRPTPPIVVIKLRRCRVKHPHDLWLRSKCVNEALGI